MVSARRFARLHNLHPNTVYRWIRLGLIPCQVKECPERHRFFIRLGERLPELRPGPVPDPFTVDLAVLSSGVRALGAAARSHRLSQ